MSISIAQAMEKSNPRMRSTRHRTVSCHFCRARKLRCSQKFPCGTCTSRGLECQLYTSQALTPSNDGKRPDREEVSDSTHPKALPRLQSQGSLVASQSDLPTSQTTVYSSAEARVDTQQGRETMINDAEWLEKECTFQGTSVSCTINIPERNGRGVYYLTGVIVQF